MTDTEPSPTRIPRGYRDPAQPTPEQAVWRAPLYFSLAVWLSVLAAWHEVGVRQINAYLPGGDAVRSWHLVCASGLSFALGALAARRVRRPVAFAFTVSLLLAALTVGASALLCFSTFAHAAGWFVRVLVAALGGEGGGVLTMLMLLIFIAMVAMIRMIATTIKSSRSEKPRFFFIAESSSLSSSFRIHVGGCRTFATLDRYMLQRVHRLVARTRNQRCPAVMLRTPWKVLSADHVRVRGNRVTNHVIHLF